MVNALSTRFGAVYRGNQRFSELLGEASRRNNAHDFLIVATNGEKGVIRDEYWLLEGPQGDLFLFTDDDKHRDFQAVSNGLEKRMATRRMIFDTAQRETVNEVIGAAQREGRIIDLNF